MTPRQWLKAQGHINIGHRSPGAMPQPERTDSPLRKDSMHVDIGPQTILGAFSLGQAKSRQLGAKSCSEHVHSAYIHCSCLRRLSRVMMLNRHVYSTWWVSSVLQSAAWCQLPGSLRSSLLMWTSCVNMMDCLVHSTHLDCAAHEPS